VAGSHSHLSISKVGAASCRETKLRGKRWDLEPILEGCVLGSGDDLLLMILVQIHEIITISRHPHQKIPIFIRLPLSPSQGLRIDDVKLNMMPVKVKISADQVA
jgi:hypothetical protein